MGARFARNPISDEITVSVIMERQNTAHSMGGVNSHAREVTRFGGSTLTRVRNGSRQRGKKSEIVTNPGLVTKQLVKEGVDNPLGVVAGPNAAPRANSCR